MNDLLRFLHILSASAWLGATLWVASDVRRTVPHGGPYPAGLAARMNPAIGLDVAMGIATVVTGLLVVTAQGGHPRTGIMIGFALSLVRIGVMLAGLRPAWRAVATRFAAGEDVPTADTPVKRMAMWSGMAHTLWLVALATMVFPI